MARVLLVNMPFSSLRWPALGLSLLKAGLERNGIGCDVAYLNFDLAERIGLDRYQWINDSFGFVLGGERLFARHLFGDRLPSDERYYREVLQRADSSFGPADRRDYERATEAIPDFLDACIRQIDWSAYAAVGFTTTFQQTLASVALAERVKRRYPNLPVLFGGANCAGPMGRELLRQFPVIDWVLCGESDATLPPLIEQLAGGGGGPRPVPPGVLGRAGWDGKGHRPPAAGPEPQATQTVTSRFAAPDSGTDDTMPEASLVRQLDELPYPDFSEYFRRLDRSPLRGRVEPLLLFETARGCWWGAKRQCTFCGLNGSTMTFRSKSPQRAVRELRHLRDRYGLRRACASDNIMDFRYFNTFLPALRDARLGMELEYELKTNLTRRQVRALAEAGLAVAQAGIETLATPVLRLMRKGVTAVQNLQTLKWLTEAGIEVKWNFLYGFPGERPEHYAGLPALFRSLTHLWPPQAVGPVRIDRFSPYFEQPGSFGLRPPAPATAYRFVFPFPDQVLARLAYYFEADGPAAGGQPPDYVRPALQAVQHWQANFPQATLRQLHGPDQTLVLLDTRPGAARFQRRLRGPERAVYLHCDAAQPFDRLASLVARLPGGPSDPAAWLKQTLDHWLADRIMVYLDGRYLGLATAVGAQPDRAAG